MLAGSGRQVRLLRESTIVDHAAHGTPGLVSIHGVRYTTARDTAAEAVDAVFRARGINEPPACRTDQTPLAGGGMARVSTFIADAVRQRPDVPGPVLTRLIRTYGTNYGRIIAVAETAPHLAAPLGAGCDVTGAEILYAAREEMALTLADALIRRTEAGSAGHPGDDAINRAAEVMAAELGWDERQRRAEIDEVQAFYELPE
jgi:glycerol-3-phosphate dehydrogenase